MSEPAGQGRTVLIVEDSEAIRHAFSFLLEDGGYRVLQAVNGAQALEISRRERPDLVLLDLGLPDMRGVEVVRRIKGEEETRGIVVVALTGRALPADEAACREAGCAGYLVKPVDTRVLMRRIPEYLRTAADGEGPTS